MKDPDTHVQKAASRESLRKEVWDWVKALVIAFAVAFGIHQFVLQQFVVNGISMEHTLLNGDRLLVDKLPYEFGTPHRGDIIVFKAPVEYSAEGEYWVKRVIGLPGDTIQVKKSVLYIDGRVVPEPFINGKMTVLPNFGPVKVPPGHIFVMGDNRNESFDSRYVGPIPISSVIGRVDALVWPLSQFKIMGSNEERLLPQFSPPK